MKLAMRYHSMPMSKGESIEYSAEIPSADLLVLLTSEVIVLSKTMELVGNTLVMDLSVRSLVGNG